LISEFITALAKEIEEVKKGKGGSNVRIVNGQFLRRAGNYYLYSFSLENFISTPDDSPVEVHLGENKYKAQILSTEGLQVEIGIEKKIGDSVVSFPIRLTVAK
jgi:hypothetical protein